jgi:hypothetical protein
MRKFENMEQFKNSVKEAVGTLSSEALGWIAVLVLHAATIPSLLALMSGLSDTPPSVDLVLMVWAALTLFFVKAAVQKDMLNLVTIALGFIVQAVMMALIFFK